MVRWILLFALSFSIYAQTHVALSTRTSVTADKITLAHSAAAPVRIQVCAAVIQSTVAGSVTVRVAGTAATTTTATPAATSPGGRAAKALAYSNSNVGTGTLTSAPMKFSAGVPFTLNMKAVRMSGNTTTQNVTLILALDSSGDATTAIYWAEDAVCEN